MTWASGSGDVNIYVDGALGKTFTSIAQGQNIPAGGTVVLGQVRIRLFWNFRMQLLA